MKLIRIIATGFVCLCVASVLAQGVALGMLWFKGGLTKEKRTRMFAMLYGIGANQESAASDPAGALDGEAGPAVTVESRVHGSSELASRKEAVRQAITTFDVLLNELGTRRDQSEKVRDQFAKTLDELESQVVQSALEELQVTLAALQPKQAKDQLVRMLDEGAWDDVISIVQAMPLDKRKKIFVEFKTDQEAATLHDIFEKIRQSEQQARAGPQVSNR